MTHIMLLLKATHRRKKSYSKKNMRMNFMWKKISFIAKFVPKKY